MGDEIQVISDGNGIALIGPQNAVDALLASSGLPSRDLPLPRLSTALRAGSETAHVAAEIASASGRWIKLTEESAQALKHADMMKGSAEGVSRAVAMQKGKTKRPGDRDCDQLPRGARRRTRCYGHRSEALGVGGYRGKGQGNRGRRGWGRRCRPSGQRGTGTSQVSVSARAFSVGEGFGWVGGAPPKVAQERRGRRVGPWHPPAGRGPLVAL